MPTLEEFHKGFKEAGGSHVSHTDNLLAKIVEEIISLKSPQKPKETITTKLEEPTTKKK